MAHQQTNANQQTSDKDTRAASEDARATSPNKDARSAAPGKDARAATPDLILGTAGHIDHGKSSLILALTGTDPDRLIEEKKRGITIELGFAELVLPDGTRMGVVDVPGHERFVRQMISGATGIDVALLCIAADDGVMPQTKEHLAVLELLDIPTCVVALTKCDLVDDEWQGLIADEVRTFMEKSPYAGCAVVPVSSRTGAGLDALREALEEAAKQTKHKDSAAAFRLPVDRSFTIKGAGTVITGTLWDGAAHVGDEIEILPSHALTRIRSIQVHGTSVDSAAAGHRTALNLNAVSTADVRPGDMLVAPGSVEMSDRFDAELRYLGAPSSERPLESGARVHVAHGTKEVVGRVLLMDEEAALAKGSTTLVQIRLDEDLPVSYNDRFVIRSFSPVYVIGGGRVLRTHPKRTTNLADADRAQLEALRAGNLEASVEATFEGFDVPVSADALAKFAEVSPSVAQSKMDELVATGKAVSLQAAAKGTEYFTTKAVLQKLSQKVSNALVAFHAQNPEATGTTKEALRQACLPKVSAGCFDALLASMARSGAIVMTGGEICHPTAGAGAKAAEKEAAAKVLAALKAGGATPPLVAELPAALSLSQKMTYKALGVLEQEGNVVKVSTEIYFEASVLNEMKGAAKARLAQGGATAAQLRDAMKTSRKYAIPLLEYFDNTGLTRREDDLRVMAS